MTNFKSIPLCGQNYWEIQQDDSSIAKTPLNANLHIIKNRGESVSLQEYSRVIGSLIYLMSCIKPHTARIQVIQASNIGQW